MLTLIVARDKNGAIGKDGDIPWHAPEDMKSFQRETRGGALIMGRLTWESLPVRPLKDRLNYVVSRDKAVWENVASSPEEAISACYSRGYRRLYGIGGSGIYRALLPLADRLLITNVDLVVAQADAWFPEIEPENWIEIGRDVIRPGEPRCELMEFMRKQPQ